MVVEVVSAAGRQRGGTKAKAKARPESSSGMDSSSQQSSQPGTSSSDFSFSSSSSTTTTSGYADIFGPADQEVERVQGVITSPNSVDSAKVPDLTEAFAASPIAEPDVPGMSEPQPARVEPLPWQREVAVLEVHQTRRLKPSKQVGFHTLLRALCGPWFCIEGHEDAEAT